MAVWMTEAVALDELTYSDVDRLCKKHLADRVTLTGRRIVRYERQEIQRFKPAFPSVSNLLLERINFDRAFRRLPLRHRRVLWDWYARGDLTQAELAKKWGCDPRTVRRRRRQAVEALRDELNA